MKVKIQRILYVKSNLRILEHLNPNFKVTFGAIIRCDEVGNGKHATHRAPSQSQVNFIKLLTGLQL